MTNTDTAQQQLAELRRRYWRLWRQRAAMLEALAGKTSPELQATLVAISETTDAEIDALLEAEPFISAASPKAGGGK